jgi:hypothetical protein
MQDNHCEKYVENADLLPSTLMARVDLQQWGFGRNNWSAASNQHLG